MKMYCFFILGLLLINCGNENPKDQSVKINKSRCLNLSIGSIELNIPRGLKLDYIGRFEMLSYENYPIRYEVKTSTGWELYWSCKIENNQKSIYKSEIKNERLAILNKDSFYFNLIELRVIKIKPVRNLHASYILTNNNCVYLWINDNNEHPYLIDLISKASKINNNFYSIDGKRIVF